ncbi:MAG TPA: enoyl-CoA hydratase-related protein [Terriglobales bacterium]|nr:enoyl-CoA hydratase-related protein [Terriglobales bacterium]
MSQTAADCEHLSVEIQPPIARITLKNSPVNVIGLAMMGELALALDKIEGQPGIAVILLSGEGNSFSAGVDVVAHAPDKVAAMLEKFHAVIRRLIATLKITIASVHGTCLGGGAELAMVCDLVYTAENAKWGFPEIQLGCFPPVAVTALAALVGQKRASELILTGRTISGSAAAEIGLANFALEMDRLGPAVRERVQELCSLSPATLAIAKKAIYAWDAMHFDKGLARAEKIYLSELMKTEDANEGIRAFIEKRSPQWKGR